MSDDVFSIKEIYLMLQSEKEERLKLTQELALTRQYIQKYNGLRKEISRHELRLRHLENENIKKKEHKQGQFDLGEAIRKWGGWIVALITVLVLLYTTFIS